VPGLNPAHGLGLSGVAAYHARLTERCGAIAWQPACCAHYGVVTVRSPHVGRRGGALASGPVAAGLQQGLGLEHHG
jgi:hypothetical protein